jgi:hypothetical protein
MVTVLTRLFSHARPANYGTGNASLCLQKILSDRDDHRDDEHNTFQDYPTTKRLSGGRQYSVDDGRTLVHKLNEPSSLIIQR